MEQKPTFLKAQEFLEERLRLGPAIKRVGVVINASLELSADVGQRLGTVIKSAKELVDAAFERNLAEFSDVAQKSTIEFFYAESRRTPANKQVEMLVASKNASSVAMAAAQQRHVPEQVQFALVEHCAQHTSVMRTLAANPATRPAVLQGLVEHPDRDVRQIVAAHIGARMKVIEPQFTNEKQELYNSIAHAYEENYAQHLVPVCRDPDQLRSMFDKTPITPKNARLFLDNPYISDDVLMDISDSSLLRVMPGFGEVMDDINAIFQTRLTTGKEREEHTSLQI